MNGATAHQAADAVDAPGHLSPPQGQHRDGTSGTFPLRTLSAASAVGTSSTSLLATPGLTLAAASASVGAGGGGGGGGGGGAEDCEEPPHLVVFSGGTAFNGIAGHMRIAFPSVSHVLPVSDDGGSTAEIVRVLGGPAVGDIRSRCLRLADDRSREARAVKALLGHRLSSHDPEAAKTEWYNIVEGEHALWEGVSEPYQHIIRAFLVHFHALVLREPSARFSFQNGSVGNFFFAGARTFFRSLDAAIFLFSRVARLPLLSAVLPAISTGERIVLGAELADGARLRGQNVISHPPALDAPGPAVISKDGEHAPLPSAIRRVFYLAREGSHREHEVSLWANPQIAAALARSADTGGAIIYGCGSLYTSIAPSLILQGVGEAVAALLPSIPRVLMLNGGHDRETSAALSGEGEMTAVDFVLALTTALNRAGGAGGALSYPPSTYVNTLLVPEGTSVAVDEHALALLGAETVVWVRSHVDARGRVHFDAERLVTALAGVLSAARSVAAVGA